MLGGMVIASMFGALAGVILVILAMSKGNEDRVYEAYEQGFREGELHAKKRQLEDNRDDTEEVSTDKSGI